MNGNYGSEKHQACIFKFYFLAIFLSTSVVLSIATGLNSVYNVPSGFFLAFSTGFHIMLFTLDHSWPHFLSPFPHIVDHFFPSFLLLYPEDGGNSFIQNFGKHVLDCTVSYPGIQ